MAKKDYLDKVKNIGSDVPEVMGKVRGEPDIPMDESGISCQAINCDHNKDNKCSTQPEITAGGACQTYSKKGYKGGDGNEPETWSDSNFMMTREDKGRHPETQGQATKE